MPRTLSALIFDVDGTLAETEEAHRLAFNQAFADLGESWEWDLDLYKQLLETSGGKERIRAYLSRVDPDRLDHPDTGPLVERLHKTKTAHYTRMVAEGAVPFKPGIAELIDEARAAGLKLAIATTTTRANVDALLQGVTKGEGQKWFDIIACSDDAPVKKPDPQVYHFVLERLAVDPTQVLALEDSANGVKAARAAEIPVVVTKSPFTESPTYPGALQILDSLAGWNLQKLSAL